VEITSRTTTFPSIPLSRRRRPDHPREPERRHRGRSSVPSMRCFSVQYHRGRPPAARFPYSSPASPVFLRGGGVCEKGDVSPVFSPSGEKYLSGAGAFRGHSWCKHGRKGKSVPCPNSRRNFLSACRLCPRECGANRLEGERGFCGRGRLAARRRRNPFITAKSRRSRERGSGRFFFSHCNMKCLFCQNYPISQYGNGREMDPETLAGKILRLQEQGAHNVNFVTPTRTYRRCCRRSSSPGGEFRPPGPL